MVDKPGQVWRVVPLGSGDDVAKGRAVVGAYDGVELVTLVPFLLSVLATDRVYSGPGRIGVADYLLVGVAVALYGRGIYDDRA